MTEFLIWLIISYTAGYTTHWYQTPSVEIPKKYLTQQEFPICKEGMEKEFEVRCMIPLPRYVLDEEDYSEYTSYIKEQRSYLKKCAE